MSTPRERIIGLIDEEPILVYPSIAKYLGIQKAVIMQQLHFLINITKKSRNETHLIDGEWWIYNTFENWHEDHFTWISISQLKRLFADLEFEDHLIKSRVVEGKGRKKWYTIDRVAWKQFVLSMDKQLPDDNSVKVTPSSYQNDTLTSTTENTAETTETKNKEKDSMPGKDSALDAPKIESPEPTPSKEEKSTPSQTPAVAQTKDGWAAAVDATREALVFGKANYNLVGRYTSFLMGRIEAEQKTKRGKQDNGEWYLMQITPGLKVLEIKAFGLFMATMYKDLPPLRTPAVVADYVGRFMGDPAAYQRFMIHASAPAPQEQKAWAPPPDAEDHSAEVQRTMAALNAKFRGQLS